MKAVAALFGALLVSGTAWGAAPPSGKDLGAVTGGEFTASQVIDAKCLSCHNRQVIDTAMKQQKDMNRIMSSMEKKGARLTDKERSVLNIFWNQNPYRK